MLTPQLPNTPNTPHSLSVSLSLFRCLVCDTLHFWIVCTCAKCIQKSTRIIRIHSSLWFVCVCLLKLLKHRESVHRSCVHHHKTANITHDVIVFLVVSFVQNSVAARASPHRRRQWRRRQWQQRDNDDDSSCGCAVQNRTHSSEKLYLYEKNRVCPNERHNVDWETNVCDANAEAGISSSQPDADNQAAVAASKASSSSPSIIIIAKSSDGLWFCEWYSRDDSHKLKSRYRYFHRDRDYRDRLLYYSTFV